ncbi:MAG: HAD hydrolase-like protein [Spirochaetes bacterium]|nr:HAD hydrolase-like protein [Spirochaetota bacterium]
MYNSKLYVIMEIENVIYDFTNYYLKMVDYIGTFLNENLGIDKQGFVNCFVNQIKSEIFVSNDYLYTTYQVLKNCDDRTVTFPNNNSKVSFINGLRMKFNQGRVKCIKFHSGALTFLKKLKDMGIVIIGFTNSSSRTIKQRLKILDIDKYFDTIYCLQDHFHSVDESKVDESAVSGIWYNSVCNNVSSLMCDVIEFPQTYLKPSKRGLQRILEDEEISGSNVIVFGNSLENDIMPSKLLGLKTVFFNTRTRIQDRSLVSKFLEHLDSKTVRKILNFPKNKKFLNEISDLISVSSLSEFIYVLESARVRI